MDRRAHQRPLHDASLLEGLRQGIAAKVAEARPKADIAGRGVLRLQPADALENPRQGHRSAVEQKLARQQRPVALASRQDPLSHDRANGGDITVVDTTLANSLSLDLNLNGRLSPQAAIPELEKFWRMPDGYFFKLRDGEYEPRGAEQVEQVIRSIDVEEGSKLPRRLVSLTWVIPTFMESQVERVNAKGGNLEALRKDITRLRNALNRFLGAP